MVRKAVIIGASGRDYHNFNVFFRNNPDYRVVAFIQTQIPGIAGRRYPPSLAGPRYPDGVPILHISKLEEIVSKYGVDEIIISYSDLTYNELGEVISSALSTGATVKLLGLKDTMITSSKPVIAVTAIKTGAGKSSVSREIAKILHERGYRVGIVRHPMAYGDLERNAVQVFHSLEDLDKYNATIEEREEYEHYLKTGFRVYAGVDYGKLLNIVEAENDVVLWDGGNNDYPFYKPDHWITVLDAMRPNIIDNVYPGVVNLKLADSVIINKVDQAPRGELERMMKRTKQLNPKATISLATSEVIVDHPNLISGKKVLVVEDSPTVTHGGAPYAAGYVAALKYGAEPIDPRQYATPFFKRVFDENPHIHRVLPSTGYTKDQLSELEEMINNVPVDAVVLGTPSDLSKYIRINKPVVRVYFRIRIVEGPTIPEIVQLFLDKVKE